MLRSPIFRVVGFALLVMALLMFLFRSTVSRPMVSGVSPTVVPGTPAGR